MRQSNVCSPAQNQACLLITSRLYDRRGLDCTAPLPLFNSLAHLVHLTATSPKIREILTRDGGLERLVRILRDFVANPPPPQEAGGFYGLLPPIPTGNSSAATAIASLNPSMNPSHQPQVTHAPTFNPGLMPLPIPTDTTYAPGFPADPNDLHRPLPEARPYDRDAAQRFSLAFQSIVNVGVRGSEAIRSRVVQAGTLEVVASVLEAWLVSKGFPLIMPRRGKKKDTSHNSSASVDRQELHPVLASMEVDGDERMDDEAAESAGMSSRGALTIRARTTTITPQTGSRLRNDARVARSVAANGNAITRPPAPSGVRPNASSPPTRAGSSRAATSGNQTTPRRTLTSLDSSQSIASSSSTSQDSSTNLSTTSLLPTPSSASSSTSLLQQQQQHMSASVTRGRSGTLVQRTRADDSSREHSTDEMEGDADTEQVGNRSGTNTEDEDMEAESSNNEIEMEGARTTRGQSVDTAVAPARTSHRPVAVADPQALSPRAHTDSLSLPGGGPGMGIGMGMEVDVLAAVNMVMAHEGVAAFEGTQFGGEAANAAAAEAIARAGREGIMEEETPRAVLRNMSERMGPLNGGELGQVDEEMGEGPSAPQARPASTAQPSEDPGPAHTTPTPMAHARLNLSPAAGHPNETAPTTAQDAPLPNVQGDTAGRAPTTGPTSLDRNRIRVMTGDAGPFRQEDVLRALQLLAYLTKYPHVRQEFYKKRVHLPAGMTGPTPGATVLTGSGVGASHSGRLYNNNPTTLSQVAPVTAAIAAGHVPQITTLFSLVERFTFRPSVSHLNLHPSLTIPTIPPEIQSWAAVIMRNACRKDDSQGGIRQCANMTCGKWEKTPREFAKCRRCRKAKYCGKECQSKAWSMGHRYWCSAREGGEPGQPATDNLDHENDETPNTATIAGQTNGANAGVGIGIAPGGGVGIVPLNNQPTNTATTANRGRTAGPVGFPPMGNQGPAGYRGPLIVNAGNNAWEGQPLPDTTPQANNVATGPTGQAATTPAAGPSTPRRREAAPTASNSSSRFARGFADRFRALAAGQSNTEGQQAEASSTSEAPEATQRPSGSRGRTWDLILGRGDAGTNVSGSTTGAPGERDPHPIMPAELDRWRQYMVARNRTGGNVHLPALVGDQGGNAASAPSDLSGLVRNNLVLATNSNQTPSQGTSGSHSLGSLSAMHAATEHARAALASRDVAGGNRTTSRAPGSDADISMQ